MSVTFSDFLNKNKEEIGYESRYTLEENILIIYEISSYKSGYECKLLYVNEDEEVKFKIVYYPNIDYIEYKKNIEKGWEIIDLFFPDNIKNPDN